MTDQNPQNPYGAQPTPGQPAPGQYPAQPYAQNPMGGPAPSQAPQSDKRTFGLWSLWLGIGGIVLAFGLPSLAAVIFGIVALIKEPRSKVLGIWGIVLGALGIIWTFLLWTVIVPLIAIAIFGAAFVSEYGTYTSYSY